MKKTKYILVIIVLWVGCQSCFQFRKSDRKQLKALREASNSYTIRFGKVNVQDRDIHYTFSGDTTKRSLLVFIHGSPGSSSNFLHFAEDNKLLGRYKIILLDRPGYGYSNFGKVEKSLEKQAQYLLSAVEEFSFDTLTLVGHSLGGPIVCRMAMQKPELVNRLLIVAGSVSAELEPEEKWRKPVNSLWLRWLVPKSIRVSNDEILSAKGELQKMEPFWKKITSKVQIIQGEKDNLVPAGNADYAEKMLVNAKSIIVHRLPEEDHFIPFSKPELVSSALLHF